MLLGFNMLLWSTHITEEHFPIFAEIKRAGYDGVEIPIFEGDARTFPQGRPGDKGQWPARNGCRRDARRRPRRHERRSFETGGGGQAHQVGDRLSGRGGRGNALRAVSSAARRLQRRPAHALGARQCRQRAQGGCRPRRPARRKLSVEAAQPVRVLRSEYGRRRRRNGACGERAELWAALRHLPLQYRREGSGRRDRAEPALYQPRPFLRRTTAARRARATCPGRRPCGR